MAGAAQYKAQQFIDAIKGSGGIVSTIAKRVGCDWHTAKKYIDNYPTVEAAYDAECETIGDLAESVVIRNIQLSQKAQADAESPVDIADAKWYLSRVRRGKYATKQETEVTGDVELVFRVVYDDADG